MLELLLKQFGLEPATLKKQVDEAATNFNKVIAHFNKRLDDIQEQIESVTQIIEAQNVGEDISVPDKKLLPKSVHSKKGE